MADIRINALATSTTSPAADDYLALDGTTNGTRKMLGSKYVSSATLTDNAIVRADGTAGQVQNSVLIVADTSGALSGFTTGNGITFHGGGTLTGASGALTLTGNTTVTGTVAVSSTGSFGGNVTLTGATGTITLGTATEVGSLAVTAGGALTITPKSGQLTTIVHAHSDQITAI